MLLNLIKLAGLLMLLGGPLFYLLVWSTAFRDQQSVDRQFYLRIQRILPVAGIFYITGSVLQLYQGYKQIADPAIGFGAFVTSVSTGLPLLNLIFVPLLIAGFSRLSSAYQPRKFAWIIAASISILLVEAATSHAAADPGWLPYMAQLLHLLAAVIWAGGLCYLLLAPWSQLVSADGLPARMIAFDRRFSRLVLFMFLLVISSGAMLAFVHVHSEAARIFTPYGQALSLKLIGVAILILTLCVHLLRTGPVLKRMAAGQMDSPVAIRKYRRLIGFETIIVIGVVFGSTMMRGHEPPATAPFLNPQTLTMSIDLEQVRITMQPVAGNLNSMRIEIFVPSSLAGGDSTRVYFRLILPAGNIEQTRQEALRVSANSYQGEAVFPVPGDWQMELTIAGASGQPLQLTSPVAIPAQPLVGDIATYLSPQAIVYNNANMITVATGLALLLLYGWMVVRAGNAAFPQWSMLAAAAGILFGLYLVFSVALVKTYPSTYENNPLPLTASVAARGQLAYVNACAECHGTTGKGDGPWAIQNRGSIPDLASPHMDVHTDGEIYWWISRGIPELDMPARDQQLTVGQRWEVITYIRSLRHVTIGP